MTSSKPYESYNEYERLVSQAYREVLQREPDPDGLRIYTKHLREGMSIEWLKGVLKDSKEYKERFGHIELLDQLVRGALALNEDKDEIVGLIHEINELLKTDQTEQAIDLLVKNTGKSLPIGPDNSKGLEVWNLPGVYYLRIGLLRKAESVYRSFYERLLGCQRDDKQRYHKGLPLHNLAVAIEPGDTNTALRYYKQAYIEDAISSGKRSLGAPAYRVLRYKFRIDEKELIGIFKIAVTVEDNTNPEIILAEFESCQDLWIKRGLTEEYFIIDKNYYAALLRRVELAGTNEEKKESLENLAEYLFSTIQGFEVRPSIRTSTSEIDRLIRNNSSHPDLKLLGDYVQLECKNWSEPVGANEIRDFVGKLRNARCNSGILISKNGITGDCNWINDAKGEIRNAFQQSEIIVINLTLGDLRDILDCKNLIALVLEKYEEVRFM